MTQEGVETLTHMVDMVWFNTIAESIHKARTQEEVMVQDLLEQWRKGGHRFVPDNKDDDILCLGCENVYSLSLFNPSKSKQRKLLNLHNKHQTDGACILEHGINFRMTPDGIRPDDIFAAYKGTRIAAAHNDNEQHSRQYKQGGTLTAAFTRLAEYVTATGVDHTGLG